MIGLSTKNIWHGNGPFPMDLNFATGAMPIGSTSKTFLALIANSGINNQRMRIQDQALQACLRRNGDQDLEQRKTCRAWRETHLRAVLAVPRLGSVDELDEEL